MILEKLSNKVNPKKKIYKDLPGKSKQTRSPDKTGNIEVRGEGRVEGERGEKKRRVVDNKREQDL